MSENKTQEDEDTLKRKMPSYRHYQKRAVVEDKKPKLSTIDPNSNVIIQFVANSNDEEAQSKGTTPQLEIPVTTSLSQMQELINKLLGNSEPLPYTFFVQEEEVLESEIFQDCLERHGVSTEVVVPVVYQPQAVFRVRSVSRCTSSLPGHSEPVLHVHFSPDGQYLASGSGDSTVRLWDTLTETPKVTFKGHKHWVQAVAWAPTGHVIASGSMDCTVRLWDPITGKKMGKPLMGHSKYITALSWEPLHNYVDAVKDDAEEATDEKQGSPYVVPPGPFVAAPEGRETSLWSSRTRPLHLRLASGSKDGTVRVWDIVTGKVLCVLSGHTGGVQTILWGGEGLLYTASRDRSIHVWDTKGTLGKLVRVLRGHAHWVNTLSVNTQYVLRTGCYDHTGKQPTSRKQGVQTALKRYNDLKNSLKLKRELLVSGSDDFTLYLWDPTQDKKPITRMTGHQQPVSFVAFSPDGQYIASASFDNSVRLWNGASGQFVAVLRAHVQAVYQVCWSADSRMLASSSKDSTIKCWEVRTRKMKADLPGHADEVFAVDWSPDGKRVASGGKDKLLRIWRH